MKRVSPIPKDPLSVAHVPRLKHAYSEYKRLTNNLANPLGKRALRKFSGDLAVSFAAEMKVRTAFIVQSFALPDLLFV